MWLSNSSVGRKVVMSVTGIALAARKDISLWMEWLSLSHCGH